MTTQDYLDLLEQLELTPASQKTAKTIGLGLRQCQRIAAGQSRVPKAVAKLLRLLVEKTS